MTTLTAQKKKDVSEKKRQASQANINKAREKRLNDKARQKELREIYGISSDEEEEASDEDTDLDEEEESVIFKAVKKKPPPSEIEALRKEIETLKTTKRKPRQKKVVFVEPTQEKIETPEPPKEHKKEPEPNPPPEPKKEPPKVKETRTQLTLLTVEERVNMILGKNKKN